MRIEFENREIARRQQMEDEDQGIQQGHVADEPWNGKAVLKVLNEAAFVRCHQQMMTLWSLHEHPEDPFLPTRGPDCVKRDTIILMASR